MFSEKSGQTVTFKNNNYNRNVPQRNERIKRALKSKELRKSRMILLNGIGFKNTLWILAKAVYILKFATAGIGPLTTVCQGWT